MSSYWTRRQLSRRAALRAAGIGASGVAALSLIGCGSDDEGSTAEHASSTEALDRTKGNPGGKLVVQWTSIPRALNQVTDPSMVQPGLSHGTLLQYKYGRSGIDPYDVAVEPDHATALPEQSPDQVTYTFKLKDGIRFHNGRTVTAQDVKYSWDRYATEPTAPARSALFWLDKVEAPDAKTVVFKTKFPWGDALVSFAPWQFGYILAKEFEEGPQVGQRYMGSGPYTMENFTPNVSLVFKKNPDYFDKPYPYFDEITHLAPTDVAKQVADIIAGQIDFNFGFVPAQKDQIKASRPDTKAWPILYAPNFLNFRTNEKPFDDQRVRQALSMTIDRKKIREAVQANDGEDDQVLSYVLKQWGFRKPSQLKGAKNWNFDPTTAKQLMSAAGVQLPMKFDLTSADPTSSGGQYYDGAALTAAFWRENGIAQVNHQGMTSAQLGAGPSLGNYNGCYFTPNSIANNPIIGLILRANFFSNPDGTYLPQNIIHVVDRELSDLVDKQSQQVNTEERKKTMALIEDHLSEKMYKPSYSNYILYPTTSAPLKNDNPPKYHFGGSHQFLKYWWKV